MDKWYRFSWKAFSVWLTTLVHVVVFSLSSGTSPGELCVLIYPDRTSLVLSVLCLVTTIKGLVSPGGTGLMSEEKYENFPCSSIVVLKSVSRPHLTTCQC